MCNGFGEGVLNMSLEAAGALNSAIVGTLLYESMGGGRILLEGWGWG